MRKGAGAYHRNHCYLFCSMCMTTKGFWIFSEPCLKLPQDAASKDLGDAILDVLNASKSDVPVPDRVDSLFEPLGKLAGVRTWRKFMTNSRYIVLEKTQLLYSFTPSENRGARGFFHLPKLRIELPANSSAENLGHALVEALVHCK